MRIRLRAVAALLVAMGGCAGNHVPVEPPPPRITTTPHEAPVTTASVLPAAPGATPTRQGLRVDGNRFVTEGRTVRLLGVSHSGTENVCTEGNGEIFQGPTGADLVAPMLAWKVNAVRVPLNEDCWLGINGVAPRTSGHTYQVAIETFVAMLRSRGLFVVLDLHWNAPGGGLAKSQLPMADADHSPAFWTSVAGAFKGDPGVVLDLYNEPYIKTDNADTTDPWACWLSGCTMKPSTPGGESWKSAGMQALVDAVRATGATNVILLGGLSYANDLSGWLAHAPHDPLGQLAASYHLYNFAWPCQTSACWTSTIAPLAARVPIVTGELGENDCDHGFIDAYTSFADPLGISYLGWAWNTWDCKQGPSLISDYDGTPTGFGEGFKAHLATLKP